MRTITNIILYSLFTSIFLVDYLYNEFPVLPRQIKWAPTLLSSIILFISLLYYAINKKLLLTKKYLILFFIFILHLLSGIILNTVPTGAIFAGMRRYFEFLPLFFFPIFYIFEEKEIRIQLKYFVIAALIQCPLAIYQRFYQYKSAATGDPITGTLTISSIMSMYQICVIVLMTAFYLKKKIKLKLYLILSIIIFFPTTLNETKGTLIIFPIALILVLFFSGDTISRFKKFGIVILSSLMIILIFIPMYNYLPNLYGQVSISEFFTKSGVGGVRWYLYRGVEDPEEGEKFGRFDTISYPFKNLYQEPFKLLFGLGIGNVNPSFFSDFEGEYTIYQKYGSNYLAAGALIWETGVIGLFLYLMLFGMILYDSLLLRSFNNINGAIALGWISVVVVVYFSLIYKNILPHKSFALFWYFSGLIVSMRANNLKKIYN